MSATAVLSESVLESLYGAEAADVDFAAVLGRAGASTDDALADLIELDGRLRMRLGKPVELRRYLDAVADLESRPVALDAAIDMALQSLSGTSRPNAASVETLSRSYPRFREAIQEAAVLGEAMMSTTGLRRRLDGSPAVVLPRDFGPRLASGVCRYQLTRLLGAGGWGEVYLGTDRQLSEAGHEALVAIKVLAAADQGAWERQRFIEEATKARRVNHANVVRVLDRGVTENAEYFIVYEHIEGGDLGTWFQSRQPASPLPPREAAAMVAQIARGVQAAHSAGLVHCDLKPGNILLTAAGQPKVADFGIAVRSGEVLDEPAGTGSGRFLGNMAFVAPEQYRMEEGCLSIPSDLYALGGILYYLLTGELPNGATPDEIAKTHDALEGRVEARSVRAARPQLDRDIDAICRRALAPRPEDRYSSGAALADDLDAWLDRHPIRWMQPSALHILRLWVVRNPAWVIGLTLTLVSIVAGTSAAVHWSAVAALRRQEAQAAADKIATVQAGLLKAAHMLNPKRGNRMGQDLLPSVIGWGWIMGIPVLSDEANRSELWQARLAIVRGLLEENYKAGRVDTFETLLWEGVLGLWLINDGQEADAERLLGENHAKLVRLMPPGDPWTRQVELLVASATVERVLAATKRRPLTAEDEAALRGARLLLDTEADAFTGSAIIGPTHRRVLRSVVDLYGPKLLNHPGKVKAATKRLKDAGE